MPKKPKQRPEPEPVSLPEPKTGEVIDPGLYKDKAPKREPYNVSISDIEDKKREHSR